MRKLNSAPWDGDYSADEKDSKHVESVLRGRSSNNMGLEMEKAILVAAKNYQEQGRARVIKTPEPFRVVKKERHTWNGIVQIRFIEHAEPDFIGCLASGRCIVFESKYTTTDRIRYSVLTKKQAESLSIYHSFGAVAGVCCGIQDRYYFVPWQVFANMKRIFGREYALQKDLQGYEVKFTGYAVMFLDSKYKKG